jgi:hypothetical protein
MVLKAIIIIMSLISSGYMAFDGLRAFITGDYLRFKNGEHAGELGPWTNIAEAMGIDPMSALMKSIFVIVGVYGLIATGAFAMNKKQGFLMLVIFCIASAWNLMFGTMSSVIVLLLLFLYKVGRN